MKDKIQTLNEYPSGFRLDVFTIAILISSIACALVYLLIPNHLDIQSINRLFYIDVSAFYAERSESMAYIIGILMFPTVYMLTYGILLKKQFKLPKSVYPLFKLFIQITIVLVFMVYMLVSSKYLPIGQLKPSLTYSFIIFPFVCLMALLLIMYFDKQVRFIKILNWLIVLVLGFVFIFYLTNTYYYGVGAQSYHFDAYFYPVYKVFVGQTILVDFNNLYGFYPYILAPILKLMGGASMLNFSIIMATLSMTSLGCICLVIYKSYRNKVIAVLSATSIILVLALSRPIYTSVNYDYYLQNFPHRTLFPILTLFICFLIIRSVKGKSRLIYKILGYFISTIAIIWNTETGLVCLLAYSAYLIYDDMLNYEIKSKTFWLKTGLHLIYALVSLVIAISIMLLITYVRTGLVLNPSKIIANQNLFYTYGFGMLKMQVIHPWIFVVLAYAIALAKSLSQVKSLRLEKSIISKEQMSLYFIISIIGLGIFPYYQGRSHWHTLLMVSWPSIFILGYMADEALHGFLMKSKFWVDYLNTKLRFLVPIFILSFMCSVFLVELVLPLNWNGAKIIQHDSNQDTLSTQLEILNHYINQGDSLDLVLYNSAALYSIMKISDIPKIPASIDMFTKEDYTILLDHLRTTKNLVVFDDRTFDLLEKYVKTDFELIMSTYILIESNAGLMIYRLNDN